MNHSARPLSIQRYVGVGALALAFSTLAAAAAPSLRPMLAATASPVVLLGNSSVAPTSDQSSGAASEAFGFTANQSGTSTGVSVYLTSTDGFEAALYADHNGVPGALLSAARTSVNTTGWATVPMPGITVVGGTHYWLAIGSTGAAGSSITYRDTGSAGTNLDYSGTGFANPYTATGRWNSNPVSAYLSGTPTATTPAPTASASSVPITGVPCTVTIGGVLRTGTCSGTFTPAQSGPTPTPTSTPAPTPTPTRTPAPTPTPTPAPTPTPTPAATPSPTGGSWSCTSPGPVNDPANGGWVYWESGCPGWPGYSDPAHFVGQNYTGGPNGGGISVSPDAWSPICTDSSGNLVDVNAGNCVHRETVTTQANSPQQFQFVTNVPANPNGSVTEFMNAGTYAYTGVVDNYTSLTSTYNQNMPINASTSAWAMQDDWFAAPGSSVGSFDYELMIQYDFTNNGDCAPAGSDWGIVANSVNIDGTLWHVCAALDHNADGTCPSGGCGAVVFKLGATEADRPAVTSSSGTIDIKAMVTWLETHNMSGQSYPMMQRGVAVAALSQGWEVCTTGGTTETFAGRGFTVTATGGAAG